MYVTECEFLTPLLTQVCCLFTVLFTYSIVCSKTPVINVKNQKFLIFTEYTPSTCARGFGVHRLSSLFFLKCMYLFCFYSEFGGGYIRRDEEMHKGATGEK